LPAWVTGLAFISANLGAIEILGMAANGAQYGIATAHFYWIGAVPAMVFLGLVMMPFYYGAKVRSVPEYLRLRFNPATHIFNALTFALASVLIAGVNLYALALVLENLLGWSLFLSICVAAGFVLIYITIGGLSGAIYNEVLQFFVILAGLIPVTVVGLVKVGGWHGLTQKVKGSSLGPSGLHLWEGTGIGSHNALGSNWIGIVLGLGFVLSFGYWTTNFAEVQRALSAKGLSAAQRTPLIGAYPKLFIPALTIIPGLVALVTIKGLGAKSGDLQYNNAIPLLIGQLLPNGVLGIAVTGLLAAFMAGMAANVSSFNTVMTYDLIQPYFIKDRDDQYYLRMGRIVTVVGIVVAVGTAGIASQYGNIMNYIQLLFGFFNAPLFATFIIAMYWKRATPWSGLYGLIAGTIGAAVIHVLYAGAGWAGISPQLGFGSAQSANFYGAITAFGADAAVMVLVSMVTAPKPEAELAGLVWGTVRAEEPEKARKGDELWWRSPKLLGFGALALTIALNIIFI
jgi:SSS family solute:Na+ symporter